MKRKRNLLIIFALLLLTACGTGEGPSSSEAVTTTIKGGRVGGAWSIFTEGIAESVRRSTDESYVTVEPGGIIENPLYIGSERVPFGLTYSMTAYAAYKGDEPYDEAYENLRAVSVVVPANHYQFFLREDLPYDSFDEIMEEEAPIRIALDQTGSAGELMTREILNQYGVTYEDIIARGGNVDYVSGSKGFELMADRRIDAAGDAEAAPSGTIIEAATMLDMKMLSINKSTIEALIEELGVEASVIPAGTYAFQDEDVHTVSTPAILLTHEDVPEEEVYAVTKAIYENLNYLYSVHEEFKGLTEEKMTHIGKVPLHPGAEKFYEEMGLLE